MGTKIVGYTRVSSQEQALEGVSLEAQRAKLEAYAVAYDLDLIAIEEDAGISASSMNRHGLLQALSMLKSGEAEGILVCKLDRLTRSIKDFNVMLETHFKEGGSELMSIQESVNTKTAGGRLVLNVLMSVFQWEREAVGERTVDALTHLKNRGVQLGGEALGWKRVEDLDEEGRRIVVEVGEEVATVDRILELKEQGLSMRGIAKALTEEGRRTKKGGKWHHYTVSKVLKRVG